MEGKENQKKEKWVCGETKQTKKWVCGRVNFTKIRQSNTMYGAQTICFLYTFEQQILCY